MSQLREHQRSGLCMVDSKDHLRKHTGEKPYGCKENQSSIGKHQSKGWKPQNSEEKSSATHPPYIAMVKNAIASNPNRKGTSRQAIIKHIVDNYEVDLDRVNTYVKSTLRRYSENGVLLRTGEGGGANGTFKLASRPDDGNFVRRGEYQNETVLSN